jgi:hypothetical protein
MKTAPIGIETQLENILFGISETEKTETENKIFSNRWLALRYRITILAPKIN